MNPINDMKASQTSYEPYKYIMSDIGNIYIGARFTYRELLENDDVNFKLKSIIRHYILKDSDEGNTLESEFYYISPDSNVYSVYEQLRVKIKVMVRRKKKGLLGRNTFEYSEETRSLKELAMTDKQKKEGEGMVISEIAISKLALMSFTV